MSLDCYVHRKCSLAVLVVLLALGAGSPAQAQLGLALVPMRAELKVTPGQQLSGALKLSSESGVQTRIRAEMDDFFIDSADTPQFERDIPKEAATSCKKWLSLNPMEIELEKGGFLLVRYTFRVPPDVAEGAYNCAAGFSTLPPAKKAAEAMGMQMQVRIVTAFYLQVGSPRIEGRLKEITLEATPPAPAAADATPAPGSPAQALPEASAKDDKGGWQAVVVLENSGKMHFRPKGTLEVQDADGKAVETQDFPSLPILRERSQRVIFRLKTHLQPGGHYKLVASVDIGTGEIQKGTADVVLDAPAQK